MVIKIKITGSLNLMLQRTQQISWFILKMCLSTRFVIENLTALTNSLFNPTKNGRDFEDLFQACALSLPVTFLTGAHVYKSDLTRFV